VNVQHTVPFCAVLFSALSLSGCAQRAQMERMVEGRIVRSREISEAAYASFTEGVIAFEEKRFEAAIRAFEVADAEAPNEPEVLTQLALAQCALRKPKARGTLAKALRVDPAYVPAARAYAQCRFETPPGLALQDSRDATHFVGVPGTGADALRSLTYTHSHATVAWVALAQASNGIAAARAGCELVKRSPGKASVVQAKALALVAEDLVETAEALAECSNTPHAALSLQRLAFDGAIKRADFRAALESAMRGGIDFVEIGLRARVLLAPVLFQGFTQEANALGVLDAPFVLAADAYDEKPCAIQESHGALFEHACGRSALSNDSTQDPVALFLEVRACLHGRIPYASVSANAQVEIATRRGLPFTGDQTKLDERHRAMVNRDAATAASPHLANSDPLRAYGLLKFALAQDPQSLIAHHPSSPMVLAWCIESGKCTGKRQQLRALAQTDRELELSATLPNAM
jgi:tetratricopeptide (TPR) repeat protein